jgi:hypothetical protein
LFALDSFAACRANFLAGSFFFPFFAILGLEVR